MKKSIIIIVIAALSTSLFGQTEKFSGGLLFSPEINIYEAEDNNKKLSLNYRYGLIGEFKINDYIYLQTGISHIKQTYDIHRMYDYCAFNSPGEPCLEILQYVSTIDYNVISVPINIIIKTSFKDSKLSPFVLLNTNNNFHLLGKYHDAYDSNVNELREFKYFGNTGSIALGIEYLLWDKLKIDLSTQLRIIEYRKKDPIVYEKEDKINTFNNASLSISLLYTF
ncbi:MAG: hypothetical protein PHW82_11940 [Bacteroidales bacterium]|nr:hypothetical protein [Bacteroidales bacterium]